MNDTKFVKAKAYEGIVALRRSILHIRGPVPRPGASNEYVSFAIISATHDAACTSTSAFSPASTNTKHLSQVAVTRDRPPTPRTRSSLAPRTTRHLQLHLHPIRIQVPAPTPPPYARSLRTAQPQWQCYTQECT